MKRITLTLTILTLLAQGVNSWAACTTPTFANNLPCQDTYSGGSCSLTSQVTSNNGAENYRSDESITGGWCLPTTDQQSVGALQFPVGQYRTSSIGSNNWNGWVSPTNHASHYVVGCMFNYDVTMGATAGTVCLQPHVWAWNGTSFDFSNKTYGDSCVYCPANGTCTVTLSSQTAFNPTSGGSTFAGVPFLDTLEVFIETAGTQPSGVTVGSNGPVGNNCMVVPHD